jgi:hypothetical protein
VAKNHQPVEHFLSFFDAFPSHKPSIPQALRAAHAFAALGLSRQEAIAAVPGAGKSAAEATVGQGGFGPSKDVKKLPKNGGFWQEQLGNSTKKSQEFVKLWSAEGRFWG